MRKITLLAMLCMVSIIVIACSKEETIKPLSTPRTDALTLDLDYADKSYLVEGIGTAVLATCEDGDTAEFIVDDQQIRVRFLGIDTPEASHFYEAWGYDATQFVCQKLEQADTIVLERNFDGVLRDTYGRYLAFIWYDGRLINLEVIEKAYSAAVGAINLKYGSDMVDAWLEVRDTGRRIHGELDPLFDYATTGVVTTIESIVKNQAEYHFKVVTVEGVITSMVGMHPYVELNGYGIYMYIGHNPSSALSIGHKIRLENVRVIYDLDRRGGIHLTDFPKATATVLETEFAVQPMDINIADITSLQLGRIVKLTSLTIETIETHIDGSFIMQVKDVHNDTITIFHSRDIYPSFAVNPEHLNVGDIITIIGPLRDSKDGWQIMLTGTEYLLVSE